MCYYTPKSVNSMSQYHCRLNGKKLLLQALAKAGYSTKKSSMARSHEYDMPTRDMKVCDIDRRTLPSIRPNMSSYGWHP
jgi:hypothetical protein